jgi:hypothetical protein
MEKGKRPQTRHLFSVLKGYKWCPGCETIHVETAFPSLKSKLCRQCQKSRSASWKADNPEKAKQVARDFAVKRRKTPQGNLYFKILGSIGRKIKRDKNPKSKWEGALGYNLEKLKEHLESRFTEGMSWEKIISGEIHIDHIIPSSFFYYESTEDSDFKQCWALENLRPAWAADNQSKNDKMPDGTRARDHRKRKVALLNEEYSVAGWESGISVTQEAQD